MVNGTPLPTAAGPLTVTVSVGLAGPDAGDDTHALLKLADEALYTAKRSGRNQVREAQPRSWPAGQSDGEHGHLAVLTARLRGDRIEALRGRSRNYVLC